MTHVQGGAYSRSRIQQQFYTRERRGVFSAAAGFDTVARSRGLSDAFVKEKIHPYCTFSGGFSAADDEVPRAITLAHLPCGRVLLGQNTFIPQDFTRQRAAFFSHNFILPPQEAGALVGDIGRIFCVDFAESYDVSGGEFLDEVSELPMVELPDDPPDMEITEEIFAHIADCVTQSVLHSKKTYILVPPDVQKREFAKHILEKIFPLFSEGVRQLLGFCTLAREPEKRRNIHLIFFDGAENRCTGGDFFVDFSDVTVSTAERGGISETSYADFIAERIRSRAFSAFFAEADFWRVRAPHFSQEILAAETEWLEKNIETFSPKQFFSVPADFIKRRKSGDAPVFVVLSILKQAAAASLSGKEISERYLLGSYFLTAESRAMAARLLRKLY